MKSIIEEAKNPGTHETIIKVASNGEGLLGIEKTVSKIEKWVNTVIKHRCQIINISVKRDKGLIDDYTVTYWDIVVPEDWDSQSI